MLLAGTSAVVYYRGVLRSHSEPRYICTHWHSTRNEARQCSADAKRRIDATQGNMHEIAALCGRNGWKVCDPLQDNDIL